MNNTIPILELSPTERIIPVFDDHTLIGHIHQKDGTYERRRGALRRAVRKIENPIKSFIPEEVWGSHPEKVTAYAQGIEKYIKGQK